MDSFNNLDLGAAGLVQVPKDEYWPDEMSDIRRFLNDGKLKGRRWVPLLKELDSIADIPIDINGFKLRIPAAFRKWTHQRRVDWAAYHWLRPFDTGVVGRDRLRGLIGSAGLDHLEHSHALTEIRSSCQRIAIQYPRLFRWVQFRVAELDMLLERTVLLDPRWRSLEVRLRRQLVLLSGLLWLDPNRACMAAEELSADSLNLAAQAAAQILRPPDASTDKGTPPGPRTRLNASLMVPIRDLANIPPTLAAAYPDIAATTSQGATTLWSDYTATVERYLVLVSETIMPRRHAGFWVPVSEIAPLPGAPEAFLNGRASLVAKQRLPALDSEPLSGRWAAYIREKVHGSFFLSFPIYAGEESSDEGQSVVGVINVNVGTPRDRVWERALHGGWLQAATAAIAPFAEIAHYAALARLAAEGLRQQPPLPPLILDTSVAEWNAFPGANERVARALITPKEEDHDADY